MNLVKRWEQLCTRISLYWMCAVHVFVTSMDLCVKVCSECVQETVGVQWGYMCVRKAVYSKA